MKLVLKMQSLLLAMVPTALFAHEGHGHIPGSNPLHYFAEPLHAIVLLVAVSAIAGVCYRFMKRHKKM